MKINNKYILLGIVIMMLVSLIEMGFIELMSKGITIPFSERPSSDELLAQNGAPAPLTTLFVTVVIEFLGIVAWFAPGFFVGKKLQRSGLSHGAIIGGIGALTTQLMAMFVFGHSPQSAYPIFWTIWSMLTMAFVCSLAGGVGELFGRRS